MTLHTTHNVQTNSVDAYYTEKPKLSKRYEAIMKCFKTNGAMTARECKNKLGLDDMNQVRPRINELCKAPYELLEVIDTKRDQVTNKNVSVFNVKNNEPMQMGLI